MPREGLRNCARLLFWSNLNTLAGCPNNVGVGEQEILQLSSCIGNSHRTPFKFDLQAGKRSLFSLNSIQTSLSLVFTQQEHFFMGCLCDINKCRVVRRPMITNVATNLMKIYPFYTHTHTYPLTLHLSSSHISHSCMFRYWHWNGIRGIDPGLLKKPLSQTANFLLCHSRLCSVRGNGSLLYHDCLFNVICVVMHVTLFICALIGEFNKRNVKM